MHVSDRLTFDILLRPYHAPIHTIGRPPTSFEPQGEATFLSVPAGLLRSRKSDWFTNTHEIVWMFRGWRAEYLGHLKNVSLFAGVPLSPPHMRKICAIIQADFTSHSAPRTIVTVSFPMTDIDSTGHSSLEKWGATYNRVTRDINDEMVLRMTFPAGVDEEALIAALASTSWYGGIGTFDVDFMVRSRVVRFQSGQQSH